ncbi:hypothetical protein D3C81_2059820 [compost metagenome]
MLLIAGQHLHSFPVGQIHKNGAGAQDVEQGMGIKQPLNQLLLLTHVVDRRVDFRVLLRPDIAPAVKMLRCGTDRAELGCLAAGANDS